MLKLAIRPDSFYLHKLRKFLMNVKLVHAIFKSYNIFKYHGSLVFMKKNTKVQTHRHPDRHTHKHTQNDEYCIIAG